MISEYVKYMRTRRKSPYIARETMFPTWPGQIPGIQDYGVGYYSDLDGENWHWFISPGHLVEEDAQRIADALNAYEPIPNPTEEAQP